MNIRMCSCDEKSPFSEKIVLFESLGQKSLDENKIIYDFDIVYKKCLGKDTLN